MTAIACDDETSGRGQSGGDAAMGQFDGLASDAFDGLKSDAADGGITSALDGSAADAFCIDPASIRDANASELQSRVLYTNDFETPNVTLAVDCPHALDARGINFLYGTPAFAFNQVNTVEGVIINDPSKLYKNPAGTGGKFALGMLSTLQDDRLSLTFDVTGKPFLNVGLVLSAIDVNGCGGPFGVARPVMKVSLYETTTGVHNFSTPGKLLDEGMITGDAPADPWTFAWKYGVVSLDASQATTARVSVVFDLLQSGYAAFDNLSIVASAKAGVVDENNDGIPDDVPVCGRTIRVCPWNPSTMDFDTNCTFVDAGQ
ncbi:MAG: hypothetical protein SF187_28660 [Deltaproteobacteria bacterium]|nr:hypothetical protein [Deltaproteobacteria bacterium]